MKKKLLSLSMALILSLSVVSSGLSARAQEPDPDPTPIVTLQPVDPNKPGEPPAEPLVAPKGEPGDNGLTPDPRPIGQG